MGNIPAGFTIEPMNSALFAADLATGPECGDVTTVWSLPSGIEVVLPRPEGRDFTVAEAQALYEDLGVVLRSLGM